MKEDMNINDLEMKSQQNNEISFKKLFNISYRGKFIILTFTSIATLIGIFYSLIQKPLHDPVLKSYLMLKFWTR